MSGSVNVLLGGVGLFLLGMALMTDGLKTAAGPALGRLLASSTQTRWRGLVSGVVVTALVQSSSAVTVAAIGFVNAGLLTFSQSLWVIFGSNVGTTMTGWLVALIGLKIKVEAAALPMIGIGMALRLTGAESRRGAAGTALAGFGVLFLGIGLLQQAFAGAGGAVDLAGLSGAGIRSVVAFVLAGLLLTVLMQSSSASLAIVLTLAETAVIPLQDAAAAVIGANIGTTVTALVAVIGATPNARRAASAHVLFNILTGLTALALLPLLIGVVDLARDAFDLDSSPAVSLALFHTVFNLLGVVLMWPLATRLSAFLLHRFRTREEEVGQPRYLDRNVASVPSLAADALQRELARFGGIAIGGVWSRIGLLTGASGRPDDAVALPSLGHAIADFVTQVSRGSMADKTAQKLATLLRVQRYYETCGELAPEIETGHAAVVALGETPLRAAVIDMAKLADELLVQLNPDTEPFAPLGEAQAVEFEMRYQQLKASILDAGARGEIDIDTMESLTRTFSTLRRIIDQATKAARLLAPAAS
ncbi:MAG: Na/Pi symporter [Gammaproteobacteria bacterium]|nr:Na/Pi symporter [Gammaproteobacteria bacterium]MBU1646062.1 Na/Pi symporter [Gammaproteobacteria bacterium]MBU1972124.1 Na/Pi symporter [Gammaproteobacteria bacterium]